MVVRRRIGAAAWVASGLLLPLQVVVALQWPEGYSVANNAISDLGVTTCGRFSEGLQQVRQVCSPWHAVFNGGMVVSGVLTAVGAILLHGWWRGRPGRVGTILMAVAGVAVTIVGLAPWDVAPGLHDGAALVQAVAQWLAMILLAVAGSGGFRWLTLAAVALSVAGFVAFLSAAEGTEVGGVSFGLAERLSFDTLALWTAAVGVAVLVRLARRPSD